MELGRDFGIIMSFRSGPVRCMSTFFPFRSSTMSTLLESPLDTYLKQYAQLGLSLPYWAVDLMRECTRLAITSYNLNAVSNNSDPQKPELTPLVKSVPGLGTLPEFAPPAYEWRYGDSGPEIAVGPEQYGLKMPKLKMQLKYLTSEDIVDFCIFYNEDFGIEPDDALQKQRSKVAKFFGYRAVSKGDSPTEIESL